ncbi:MAG: efflux RND transporter periplasmic adaptor subunit [bacterium]|nr:efflux RND transporter periplasmic adaptor subunit [bacterium]
MKKGLYFITIILMCVCNGCKEKDYIEASGTIEIKELDVASKIAGRVTKIYVQKGDNVEKDKILAEIDDRIINAQYDEAKAVYTQAEEDFKRVSALYKSNSIPKQKYDQSEAFYNQIKAKLTQAEIMKEETKIKAPWDGTIINKYVEEGELISQLAPLLTLGDMKEVKLTIYMPLKEMEIIKVGDEAEIRIDAYKDRTFKGKITYISDKAEFTPKNIQTKDERIKEVFAIEISLSNDEGIFKPGMPADARLKKG